MVSRTIIEAGRSHRAYWSELWQYRELFYMLTWRDVKVRYKQTTLGILWAIIRPLLTMLVFTFIFGRIAGMQAQTAVPYAIIVFAGVLPWQFFAGTLTETSGSLIGNERLITKIYFPRIIIPASTVITGFLDFLISLGLLVILFLIWGYMPPVSFFALPLFTVLAVVAAAGPGLLLTALNVQYRDFRYIVPFLVQVGLFISPVGFESHVIPETWKYVFALNPMAGVIDGFRWCIVQGAANPLLAAPFYISLASSLLWLFIAFSRFRRMEKNFADLL